MLFFLLQPLPCCSNRESSSALFSKDTNFGCTTQRDIFLALNRKRAEVRRVRTSDHKKWFVTVKDLAQCQGRQHSMIWYKELLGNILSKETSIFVSKELAWRVSSKSNKPYQWAEDLRLKLEGKTDSLVPLIFKMSSPNMMSLILHWKIFCQKDCLGFHRSSSETLSRQSSESLYPYSIMSCTN